MDAERRIRVLFPYADGDTIGGSHTSSLELALHLDRRVFAPLVLLHGAPGALGRHVVNMGLPVRRLELPRVMAGRLKRGQDSVSLPRYLLCAVPALVRLLRAERIDIVHTNDGGMHASWALPTKLAGARFVWHHRQAPDARGVNLVAPLFANHIFSVSEFSRPSRPVLDVANRFEVARSPFTLSPDRPDRDASRAALLHEIGASADACLIGYFGALTHRKRPDHFIHVVNELRRAMPDRPVHGLIFGKEPVAGLEIEARCRRLVDTLGLNGQLHLMGHRTPVDPCIAGVDVLAVTALDEPFGRTLIEAMHLGTPVVATCHGGNIEAIEDGQSGFLVDPFDPADFVPAIETILHDPQTRQRITTAAAQFARSLTVEAHVSQVSSVYRSLVSSTKILSKELASTARGTP
ncbi:glycosyltransferase family 4 protein [Palleronia abyssalis]|mgnify:CR=1 FL=1|uniref:D-inositol 3-phosphate glycosyltransferase n=1 Tax=Palleronia abyssalis TaxID=1501240 RepID=A0A2R8BYG6_9RHOB|nr:glycosyltransferase family 4 protein [Palleronia abyssalis]SPJ25218.1 D-inositol 3-phosphate glycosyltransferase [Palleronia abyssalis]